MDDIALYKELIEAKLDVFRLQQGRLVSDWKSEQDNRKILSTRVEDALRITHELNSFKTLQYEKLEIFDKILRNGGNGLVMKVDRLEQASSGAKGRLTFFVSLAAIIIGLLNLILHYLK